MPIYTELFHANEDWEVIEPLPWVAGLALPPEGMALISMGADSSLAWFHKIVFPEAGIDFQ